MEQELIDKVDLYNEYSDGFMEVWTLSRGFYRLVIDGEEIMEGDDYDLIERVKGINREYGYNNF